MNIPTLFPSVDAKSLFRCPACRKPIEKGSVQSGSTHCPFCQRPFELRLFDPPLRIPPPQRIAGVGPQAAAVCSNHPRNAATQGCQRCGSFICQLCAIETDGLLLCPSCYDRLSSEGALPSTTTRFRDLIGLSTTMVVAGFFMWPLMIVFGPLSMLYAVRGVRQRKQLGDIYSPLRVFFAFALGIAETLGGVAMIFLLIREVGR